MSTIEERLQNVRTLEDIVNLLTILFTNLNNQNEQYYDMFLNPVPMDLDLERYDENGELVTVVHPNVAKMRISTYTGTGSPNGKVAARVGSLYIDLSEAGLYYKGIGDDSYGWVLVWSSNNFVNGEQYLRPDGDASHLQTINANSISSGVVKVQNGGTGTTTLTGLVKGNGTNAFTAAQDGVDYIGASDFIGLVMWSPLNQIYGRWLVCDGTIYSTVEHPEYTTLCSRLGSKYGGNGTTTFGVPNLLDKYPKGSNFAGVGVAGNAHVGEHNHALTGTTGSEDQHKHAPGNLNVKESYFSQEISNMQIAGAFSIGDKIKAKTSEPGGTHDHKIMFSLGSNVWDPETRTSAGSAHSHSLSGNTANAGSGTNDVDHLTMVPVIRY